MRNGNGKNLKPLAVQYIQQHIHEFVFAVLDGEKVGVMRLFTPPSCPDVIEMGSFVKVDGKGTCTKLIQHAEQYAENLRKTVIAVTAPNTQDPHSLAAHLKRLGWEVGTQEKYQSRIGESPGKVLWQNPPKRFDFNL